MSEEVWDKKAAKAAFDSEIEKAREYLSEKKKITPKPEEFKKITTLSDDEEWIILSGIKTKGEVIETLSSFKNDGSWGGDIQRLTKEVAELMLMLDTHKIQD